MSRNLQMLHALEKYEFKFVKWLEKRQMVISPDKH